MKSKTALHTGRKNEDDLKESIFEEMIGDKLKNMDTLRKEGIG